MTTDRLNIDLVLRPKAPGGPEALGDLVISTGVVRTLLQWSEASHVTFWTDQDWIFNSFSGDPRFSVGGGVAKAPASAIDLAGYLHLRPHTKKPRKHHVASMLEVVAAKTNLSISKYEYPIMTATNEDREAAEAALKSAKRQTRYDHLVWLCSKSSTDNRNPGSSFWSVVARELAESATLCELLAPGRDPSDPSLIPSLELPLTRLGPFMTLCDAGIAVDTFGLHLAAANGVSIVVAVLGSSHPQCVCYPGNRPVFRITDQTRICQPCGHHGYTDERGILADLGITGGFIPGKRCVHPNGYPCLDNLDPQQVASEVKALLTEESISLEAQ